VPMLLAGDELGRTQGGNNNAYCQDNEVSWVDWSLTDSHGDLLEFARELAAFRREHSVFRRRRFFRGGDGGDGPADIAWLTPSGREMADQDWNTPYARAMMVFLNGDAITEPGPRGEPVRDDTFLILLSANQDPVTFTLPGPELGRRWTVTLDTAAGQAAEGGAAEGAAAEHRPGGQIVLAGHSMMVLRRTDPAPAAEAPEAGQGMP